VDIPSFVNRAEHARGFDIGRLEKTDQLDRFLEIVKGYCPVHFAAHGELVDHGAGSPFYDCPVNGQIAPKLTKEDCKKFRNSFGFAPFTYCFHCGSPQERKFNKEAPKCHKDAGFGPACPWADFPFTVVLLIWHREDIRKEMMVDFRIEEGTTYSGFQQWCTEEYPNKGEYVKMLEVFLWYCKMHFS
jgi:hypothetical protein